LNKRVGILFGLLIFVAVQPAPTALAQPEATLEGRAILPADTFAEGPSSGSKLEEETKGGRTPPFNGQPVGGVSAVLKTGADEYLAMADNGFGKKENSADFLLRAYRIRPDFETAGGGRGNISVSEDFVQLRDPDRLVPFRITNEESEDRLLTGADFDIESVRRDNQGGLWFGDEFGPFLLHTDATGRVLEAPIPLPDVKSPENPLLASDEEPNLPTSKGFEGMAISESGDTLYPMLEGALQDDEDGSRRFIYEFDLGRKSYTGKAWQYRTEVPDNAIGDLTALGEGRFLIIERDNEQGKKASFKKVYEVDLTRTDADGFLLKREVLDLLSINDPNLISQRCSQKLIP
jgi:glycerophosphoryl diester phosphodiesterase